MGRETLQSNCQREPDPRCDRLDRLDRQWWNPGENDQRDLSRFATRDKKERVQFGAGGGDSSIKNH